ncbi:hypothetical protein MRX96_025616 [Rhipicephalus microplus]
MKGESIYYKRSYTKKAVSETHRTLLQVSPRNSRPLFSSDPWGKMPCIPAATCPPECPRYSSFQLCSSNCEPKCNGPLQNICAMSCDNGSCLCWPGFYTVFSNGKKQCVPPNQCPRRQ